MKTLTSIIAIILILSVFGCRENLINQPEMSAPLTELIKTSPAINSPILKGEISICYASFDPLSGDCKINGKVTYIHNTLNYIGGVANVQLNIELDAELCTKLMNPARNYIYGVSIDTLLMADGKLLLDKTYNVEFRPDLRLCVEYYISSDEVKIMQMNLLQVVN